MTATTQHAMHAPSPVPVLRITPPSRWWVVPFAELWEFRELIYFFVWRDIKIRYKQTAIGAAWAVLQPFLMMLVFSLFFGKLGNLGLRRPALSDLLLQRAAALDVFRRCAAEFHQYHRRKSALDHQSLFPAAGVAAFCRALRTGGFRRLVLDVCRADDLLPHSANAGAALVSRFPVARDPAWRWAWACGFPP